MLQDKQVEETKMDEMQRSEQRILALEAALEAKDVELKGSIAATQILQEMIEEGDAVQNEDGTVKLTHSKSKAML